VIDQDRTRGRIDGLVGSCARCQARRPLEELLVVVAQATGQARHVCRPALDTAPETCFRRSVGPRDDEAIALAVAPRTLTGARS
jgi:hypothetical protein